MQYFPELLHISRNLLMETSSPTSHRQQSRMPSSLVVVLIPKVIYIDHLDDVVALKAGRKLEIIEAPEHSKTEEVESAATEELEHANTTSPHLTEVNLRQLVFDVLEQLFAEHLLYTHPNIVEDAESNSIQAICVANTEAVEQIVHHLLECGVGTVAGSVNVVHLETSQFHHSAELHYSAHSASSQQGSENGSITSPHPGFSLSSAAHKHWSNNMHIVSSSVRVEQLIERMEHSATMSFDYVMLLIIASTIAGIGLATDSVVAIVASMLVSPLMGPVIALTFGATVHDRDLFLLGLRTELTSLFICVCVGALIGVVALSLGTEGHWPTVSMRSRGALSALAIGVSIAIPSGMGVALSILGNNTSSLVGVAISASLLTPAVNCGLALMYAAVGFQEDPNADEVRLNRFDTSEAFARLGGISLALTLVNLCAVFFSAWLVFTIKEVTPMQNKAHLWEHGIQAFREFSRQSHALQHQQNDLHRDDDIELGDIGNNGGHVRSASNASLVPSELSDFEAEARQRGGMGQKRGANHTPYHYLEHQQEPTWLDLALPNTPYFRGSAESHVNPQFSPQVTSMSKRTRARDLLHALSRHHDPADANNLHGHTHLHPHSKHINKPASERDLGPIKARLRQRGKRLPPLHETISAK